MRYQKWEYLLRNPKNILDEILSCRGIQDKAGFLNVDYRALCSTKKLKNISKADRTIKSVISSGKKIGIFCDYDADGVCAGAIIYKTIQRLGGEVIEYVPERKEGYGLNKDAVRKFIEEKVGLVITLDCGIKNHAEINILKNNNIKVVVVDHHQIPDVLPEADCIVHPSLTKDRSNLELSGGGTAYMLARSLLNESGQEKWLIDLAAISSVADIVPLNHDNRIIVKYGMMVLEKTKNKGLSELLRITNLKNKKLSTYDLGFILAPRLNAASRVAHPRDSFDLLISQNQMENSLNAKKLDELNKKRQKMLLEGVECANLKVKKEKLDKNNLIILKGDYDEGIVGLIASKICDRYYRPTIVLSEQGTRLKGSARSIESINITDLISTQERSLLSFGGHSQAAGLSLEKRFFKTFCNGIIKEAGKISHKAFERILKVDALIKLSDINEKNFLELEQLSPFGPGNARPIFALENVKVLGWEIIGQDKSHRKLRFSSEGQENSCLIFGYEDKNYGINLGDEIDIAFTICLNEFRNKRKLDLIIEDVKKNK